MVEYVINYEERKKIEIVPVQHGRKGTMFQLIMIRISIEISVMMSKAVAMVEADMDSAYDKVTKEVVKHQHFTEQQNASKRVFFIKNDVTNNNYLLIHVQGESVDVVEQECGIPQGSRMSGDDQAVHTNKTYIKLEGEERGIKIPIFTEDIAENIKIYNEWTDSNNNKYMLLPIFAYVDDNFFEDHSTKKLEGTVNIAGNDLVDIGARYKYSKTKHKVFNAEFLNSEEFQEVVDNKVKYELYGEQLEEIKEDYIEYLGIKWQFDEILKQLIYTKQIIKNAAATYGKFIGIAVGITKSNKLTIKRAVLISGINIHGLQMIKINEDEQKKMNMAISYGHRKLFGLYQTTRHCILNIMIGIYPIDAINCVQMIDTYRKIKEDETIKIMIETQRKLVKERECRPIIKRRRFKIRGKDGGKSFKVKEEHKYYVQDIDDIAITYGLEENEEKYKYKILNTHFYREYKEIINDKNCLLRYIFDLKEHDIDDKIKAYSTKILKNIQEFIMETNIDNKITKQLFRMISGNHSVLWKVEKQIKEKGDFKCNLCNLIKQDWNDHMLGAQSCNEIKSELQTINNEENEKKKDIIHRLKRCVDIITAHNKINQFL